MEKQNTGYSRHRAFKAMCAAKRRAEECNMKKQATKFDEFMSGDLLKYEGNGMIGLFKEELLKKNEESFIQYADRIFHFMARNIGMRLSYETADALECLQNINDATIRDQYVGTIAVLNDTATYFILTYFGQEVSLDEFMEKLEFIWWTYA